MCLFVSNGAQAGVIFGTGNPGNAGTDNVIFNACTANVTDGTTVNGCLNTDHTALVDFFNAGESLHVDGGQARIEATDGSFTQLEFGFNNPLDGFTKAIFNINTDAADEDGTITITVNFLGGLPASVTSSPFNVANGSNFFYVVSDGGDVIDSVFFKSSIGLDSVLFQDTRQVRLGGEGIEETTGDVSIPEPAMLSMLGLGLLGAAARYRRRA